MMACRLSIMNGTLGANPTGHLVDIHEVNCCLVRPVLNRAPGFIVRSVTPYVLSRMNKTITGSPHLFQKPIWLLYSSHFVHASRCGAVCCANTFWPESADVATHAATKVKRHSCFTGFSLI